MPAVHRPRATADLVADQLGHGPHPVAELLALGLSRGQVRAALDSGWLRRVARGVVVVSTPPAMQLAHPPASTAAQAHRVSAAATLLTYDGAVVSHESAGVLLGMPSRRPGPPPTTVSVTVPGGRRLRGGVRSYAGPLEDVDVVMVDGLRCTSVARTALDLARESPLSEALVVLDWAVARTSTEDVLSALTRHPSRHGRAGLARAIAHADPRSESPLESASRGSMIMAGLPTPELQVSIRDDDGRWHRVDFLWRRQRVIGESDGWGKYDSERALRAEKRREDALRLLGYRVVRWTSDQVWPRPDAMLRLLRRTVC